MGQAPRRALVINRSWGLAFSSLPSCFRFGVGVVYITAHYQTHAATTGRFP